MTGGIKLENVQHNGLAALNTEDGSSVVIVEGTAKVIPVTDVIFEEVAQLYDARYEWDIHDSLANYQLIEVSPVKTLAWET